MDRLRFSFLLSISFISLFLSSYFMINNKENSLHFPYFPWTYLQLHIQAHHFLLPPSRRTQFCYFVTRITFLPVFNTVFLIVIQDLSKNTFLTKHFSKVYMSSDILFMIMYVLLMITEGFFILFLSRTTSKFLKYLL